MMERHRVVTMRDELMEKMGLDDIHEKEKNFETVLHESRSAVQDYVRTGHKSVQLQLIMECEEKFQENYKRLLQRSFREDNTWQGKIEDFEKALQKCLCESKALNDTLEVIYDMIQDYLQSILTEMAYYHNMNMIYEFLDNEKIKRKEEERYETALQDCPRLEKIIIFVEQKRRVFLKDVQKQLEFTKNELEKVINAAFVFFIIEEKDAGTQISLSPQGMKLSRYIAQRNPKWSAYDVDRCVYRNCFEIMDKMENSLFQSRRLEVKIESVSPSVERAIKSKYTNIFNNMCIYKDEKYSSLLNSFVLHMSEKDEEKNEKFKYRISRKSEEIY